MEDATQGGNPPEENPPAEGAEAPAAEEAEAPAEAPAGRTEGFYQGKPVLVVGGLVYPLPAPIAGAGPENVTETAEEYDAAKEAETATTPETEGVTVSNG